MAKADIISNNELPLERELIEAWRALNERGRQITVELAQHLREQLARDRRAARKKTAKLPSNVCEISKAGTALRVVPAKIPDDTVGALVNLLAQARCGMVLGMAFAVMYRDRTYIVDATDEARRSPTFTRGMIAYLDGELEKLVNGDE
ncbi:MAG: hypothetical protein ACRETC_08595 [Gammaproteobacteria bacterium]